MNFWISPPSCSAGVACCRKRRSTIMLRSLANVMLTPLSGTSWSLMVIFMVSVFKSVRVNGQQLVPEFGGARAFFLIETDVADMSIEDRDEKE